MNVPSRRRYWSIGKTIGILIICAAIAGLLPSGPGPVTATAASEAIMHPLVNPPQFTEAGPCPNCGMVLNMWARTRHAFTLGGEHVETCSIRCLADLAKRSGTTPTDVKVALYLEPEKTVDAGQAAYLIGSSAVGTMTMVSKIAFADREAARQFAAANGGEIVAFDAALARATEELEPGRAKISENRLKSGKIKEPAEADHCTVCGMMPAKFPAHRAQILTGDDSTLHFCSTHCLVEYLAKPTDYIDQPPKAKFTWVTVFPEGGYDYAGGMYYVVGSKVMGPMGPEALPVRGKAEADALAAKEGGKVARLAELTPALLMGSAPVMDMGKMEHK